LVHQHSAQGGVLVGERIELPETRWPMRGWGRRPCARARDDRNGRRRILHRTTGCARRRRCGRSGRQGCIGGGCSERVGPEWTLAVGLGCGEPGSDRLSPCERVL
ncbi:MAG: hypothetical protein ACK55I_05260, partial [bacterium]